MHRELIDKIIDEGSKEDMECLKHILVDLIDELTYSDREKYKKIEYKLYKKVHGEHLDEETAKCWVSHMQNKDGTKGEHWTLEQTTPLAGNYNKYDFYATINMIYSDYYNSKFDTDTYVELAKDWLKDPDVPEGKTLKYYMLIARA